MQAAVRLEKGDSGGRLREFVEKEAIRSFISEALATAIRKPIRFIRPGKGGAPAMAFEATLLIDLCEAILFTYEESVSGVTREMAKQAQAITTAYAKTGIVAHIDEVTGYQYFRARNAIDRIIEKYIAEEYRKWTKTFPDEYYEYIFKLKGWNPQSLKNKPSVIGHYTNDIVYSRMAPSVLEELRNRNPVLPSGRRKRMHHQWLTGDIGNPRLKSHLEGILALMKAADDWTQFQALLDKAYPKFHGGQKLFP